MNLFFLPVHFVCLPLIILCGNSSHGPSKTMGALFDHNNINRVILFLMYVSLIVDTLRMHLPAPFSFWWLIIVSMEAEIVPPNYFQRPEKRLTKVVFLYKILKTRNLYLTTTCANPDFVLSACYKLCLFVLISLLFWCIHTVWDMIIVYSWCQFH